MKLEFDMNNPYQVANSVVFSEDMLECATRLDRFVELAEGNKNKHELIDALLDHIKMGGPRLNIFLSLMGEGAAQESYSIIKGREVVNHYLLTHSDLFTETYSTKDHLAAIARQSQSIKDYFTQPFGPRVKESFIHKAIGYLDQQFSFSELILNKSTQIPLFLLYNNGTTKYNSGCGAITYEHGTLYYLDLFHLMPQTTDSPEYILFHELGHMVQAACHNLQEVPATFLALDINAPFREAPLNAQLEQFANAFAMVAVHDNDFIKYAPRDFMNTSPEVIHTLDKYFHEFIR